MLAPDYLDHAPDRLVLLFQQVEDDILRDVARRISKMDTMTPTANWQLWRYEQTEALRQDVYLVGMAHKADLRSVKPFKQEGRRVHAHFGLAVLAGRSSGGSSAEGVGHKLGAVAYAQNRYPQLEHALVDVRRALVVDAVGSTGKDDSRRSFRLAMRRTSSAVISPARTMEYTEHSRTRLAISSLYCPPKSKIKTH